MYWKVAALRMMVRVGVRVQLERAAVCACRRPPKRDECSGASHWPVGCDSLTSQGASEHAGTMQDE